MQNDVVALFREYMGTGLTVIWFFVAVVYLWLHEKRKHIRIVFLYMPVIVLLIYFNPVFSKLVYGVVGEEIYYRILWLLPVTVVIGHACALICSRLKNDRTEGKRSGFAGLSCAFVMGGIIAVSGSCIYGSPLFTEAENLYHMPDSVVHICDAINVPGREVMAVFPMELVQYVRQYSPVTCMPYGREVIVDNWNIPPLCVVMEAEVIDLEQLVYRVREAGCHYCILPEEKEIVGNPEDYGWIRFGETDGYVIYRDPAQELIVPELP